MAPKSADRLPLFPHRFFWEYDPESIQVNLHRDFIAGRIVERGTWQAMQWLQKTYTNQQLVDFLQTRGKRTLPARELNYWATICGIPDNIKITWLRQVRERTDSWSNRYVR